MKMLYSRGKFDYDTKRLTEKFGIFYSAKDGYIKTDQIENQLYKKIQRIYLKF